MTSCGSSPPCVWRPRRPIRSLQPTASSTRRTFGWSARPTDSVGQPRHSFAAAAEAMRRILVDAARRKRTDRHGGDRRRVELPDVPAEPEVEDDRLLVSDAALVRLAAEDPVAARVVEPGTSPGCQSRTRPSPPACLVPQPTATGPTPAWLKRGRLRGRPGLTSFFSDSGRSAPGLALVGEPEPERPWPPTRAA